MAFQNIRKVLTSQELLGIAFRRATKRADIVREKLAGKKRLEKSNRLEQERVSTVTQTLKAKLNTILTSFPRYEELDPFYQELIKCTVDKDQLKQSLGAVKWVMEKLVDLAERHRRQLKLNKFVDKAETIRRAYYGRASSVVKQIDKNLAYLEETRKKMRKYPTLKTTMITVVLAGAPNVGKSTLLAALTGSKPSVAYYPFTTKQLNLGYDKENNLQYVDTPGLLDRPLADRNRIEQQAILALKHLAKLIVFILDPSESCGYPIADQENILNEIKRLFHIPILLVANKADIVKPEKKVMAISAKSKKDVENLKQEIIKQVRNS